MGFQNVGRAAPDPPGNGPHLEFKYSERSPGARGKSRITCASMRVAELRGSLVREILRASAIGMQAQAALIDGDDEAALGHLRRHWIVMRTDVSPMASELGSLLKESP